MNKKAPLKFKASLQDMLTFMTYGVGWLIGTNLSGWELQRTQILDDDQLVGHDWMSMLLVPAGIAMVVAFLFILFFKDEREKVEANIETII